MDNNADITGIQILHRRMLYAYLTSVISFIFAIIFYFLLNQLTVSALLLSLSLATAFINYLYKKNIDQSILNNSNIILLFLTILSVSFCYASGITVVSFFLSIVCMSTLLINKDRKAVFWWSGASVLATVVLNLIGIHPEDGTSIFNNQWMFYVVDVFLLIVFAMVLGHHSFLRKRKMELLFEQRKSSVRLSSLASIGRIAGGLSDEIQIPIDYIQKNIKDLKSKLIANSKFEEVNYQRSIEIVEKTLQRIKSISDTLKQISEGNRGFEIFVIRCDQFVDQFKKDCQGLNLIGVDFRIHPNVVPKEWSFYGNPTALTQVLQNLVQNAKDAIENHSSPWIQVEFSESVDFIIIKVTDCGNGIPAKELKKIFAPFYTTKEVGKGTGLGLALCLSYAKKMKANLYYNYKSQNTQFVLEMRKA